MRHMFPALLLAVLALAPGGARGGVPSPSNCTIPKYIVLVGLNAALQPDSALGHFTVTVRDLGGNPVPNSVVSVDFLGCNDLRIAADQHDPRLVVGCGQEFHVDTHTGADGVASFTIVGSSYARAGTAGEQMVRIYWAGAVLGTLNAAAYDVTGTGGVNLADLGYVFRDYFSGLYVGRCDYDGNGLLTLGDLGLWWSAYFAAGSTTSPATVCP